MATDQKKIDSNSTGAAFAEEASFGVLPGSPIWYDLEPNKYANFGADVKTVARNPINPSRQRKKGVTVGVEASGGFNMDLTQENHQRLLQGFLYADLRTKAELAVATITGAATDDFEPAAGGAAFKVGDLLFAKGFGDSQNNGLKKVKAPITATSVPVTTDLSTAAGQSGIISRAGFEFDAGDAQIDAAGSLPKLTTVTKDLTELGLIVGEFVFLGGDTAGTQFATAANNGFARVRSVAVHAVEFDKTQGTMVTDTGVAKTVRLFCGRVLKNESGTSIKRRTYQIERTLGAPDSAQPAQIQSEYLVGSVPSEAVFNVSPQDKLNTDLSFISKDVEFRDGATGPKSGAHVAVVEASAFNTTSDFSRVKLASVGVGNVTPLVGFFTDLKFTVNNHLVPDKAVGVLGAFEVTAGLFDVSGSLTAYFTDTSAPLAVRNNSDITLDVILVKENAGIVVDLPLLSLSDGRMDVKQDEAVKVPLSFAGATGKKVATALDHTLLFCFFDYLPNAADL